MLQPLPQPQIKKLKKKNNPASQSTFESAVFAGYNSGLNTYTKKMPGYAPAAAVLLALSGGADSTAMTAAMSAAMTAAMSMSAARTAVQDRGSGLKLYALHVNHGIRPPGNCAADEALSRDLCAQLQIPFFVVNIPPGAVKKHAEKYGTGIEASARHFRYLALGEEATRLGASAVLTAHTADDRLETILMAFLRGGGPSGLGALSSFAADATFATGAVPIIRPLLSLSREDVLSYLKEKKLSFCTDETNSDTHFFRNRVRRHLVPLLDEQFTGWRAALLRLGETQAMTSAFLKMEAEKRLVWENGASGKAPCFKTPSGRFFLEPGIIREEALFQVFNRLINELPEIKTAGKKPRRDAVRRFACGLETAVDLGQARAENKKGWVSVKKAGRGAACHGFSVLIKKAGVYKLNELTVIADGEGCGAGEPVFYAALPLAVFSESKGKILAEDSEGCAAVVLDGKLDWKRSQDPVMGKICFKIQLDGGSFTDGSE